MLRSVVATVGMLLVSHAVASAQLLCCVMFLLVTAVWNQLAAVETSTPSSTARPEQLTSSVLRRIRNM